VSGNGLTDAGLIAFRRAPHVHTLELRRTGISDAGCDVFVTLPSLHCLDVPDTRVTERGVAVLAAAPNLQSLSVDGRQLTASSADALATAPNLVEMYLYGREVDGERAIVLLQRLPKLMELTCPALFSAKMQSPPSQSCRGSASFAISGTYPADFEQLCAPFVQTSSSTGA
jgi:hypothetical protein